VWLGFSTAGDRSDEILHAMGYRAARGADHIAICTLPGYMRGRDPQDFLDRLRAGALDGGATEVPDFPDELHSLRWLLDQSVPSDVIAATSLAQRTEIFAFLDERGARRMGSGRVRQQVRRLRAKRVSSTLSPS
jgi:cyanophycin synthetase